MSTSNCSYKNHMRRSSCRYSMESHYQCLAAKGQSRERRCPTSSAFASVRQSKKIVTFKPTATVRMYPKVAEKSKLYYSKQELNVFNLETRAICTLSQELPHIRNSGTMIAGLDDDDNDIDSLRGLELLMFPKRKQTKVMAKRSLVKYQTSLNSKPNMTSERKHRALAAASAKLNLWSSIVAVETARLDSLRAYGKNYMIPIDMRQPPAIALPFPFYKKRLQRSELSRVSLDNNSPGTKRRKIEQL